MCEILAKTMLIPPTYYSECWKYKSNKEWKVSNPKGKPQQKNTISKKVDNVTNQILGKKTWLSIIPSNQVTPDILIHVARGLSTVRESSGNSKFRRKMQDS